MARLMAATLAQTSKTHCAHGHEYSAENLVRDKRGWRRCKECAARLAKERWAAGIRPAPRDRREYHALRYQERKKGTWQYREHHRPRPKIGEEVHDLLIIEGGWWTLDAIVLRLPFNRKSVSRILSRLRTKGKVQSRRVQLATGRNRLGLESRTEWKAVPESTQMVLAFDD